MTFNATIMRLMSVHSNKLTGLIMLIDVTFTLLGDLLKLSN